MKKLTILGMFIFLLFACEDGDNELPDKEVTVTYEFENDAMGWIGDFADYYVGEDDRYELKFEYNILPAPLDESEGALRLTGSNLSDDLFMFVKKQVTELQPNTNYNVDFEVQFASNVPDGMQGIGGSPGESVYIKAGATPEEPKPMETNEGLYRMNINKGNQSQSGQDMIVIGDFSNDTDMEMYQLKTVSNDSPFDVRTDENGNAWLCVGTDSGFEGTTTIYINTIRAEFVME